MIVIFLPCVAPARRETQAAARWALRMRAGCLGIALRSSAWRGSAARSRTLAEAAQLPSALSECHLLTARAVLRMWLRSVVFPAPKKPVRMVTGTRRSSSDSSSVGAILRVGMTGLGAEVSGSTAGAPSSQERAWGGRQLPRAPFLPVVLSGPRLRKPLPKVGSVSADERERPRGRALIQIRLYFCFTFDGQAY